MPRTVIPLLNVRNPYRNTSWIVKRQQVKGRRQRKQRGGNILFGPAVKAGVILGRSKKYRRMSRSGFSDTGGRRYRKPWEV